MKQKKKITLGTVITTSFGALFFVLLAVYHRRFLANTTALALMITFAVSWSSSAIIQIFQYLKQRKEDE